MRFFASAAAVMAMISAAAAQAADFDPIFEPQSGATVNAGSTFEVTWEAPEKYQDGTISIHLIGGASDTTLVPIADIATGVSNAANTYSWTVDASLGADATYGLVFRWEADPSIFQYSNPFHIAAASGDVPPVASSSSVSAGVTVTTAEGVVTVTLTSCPPSSTSTPVTTSSFHHNTTISTSTISTSSAWNTTFVPPPATSVVLPPPVVTTPAPAPTTPAPVPTGVPAGAARFYSGSALVLGGVAVALFL